MPVLDVGLADLLNMFLLSAFICCVFSAGVHVGLYCLLRPLLKSP
jgi:hypothetical protein